MKFSLAWDDIINRTSLKAGPDRYDGFPSPDTLLVGWSFRTRPNANRQLVAGILAFDRYLSGELSAESLVDKVVADAIAEFFSHRHISVTDISLRPKEPAKGTAAFVLGVNKIHIPELDWRGFDSPRQIALIDHRISERSGPSFEASHLAVPTNAFVHATSTDCTSIEFWMPRLAVALLMADDFEVGEIWMPSNIADGAGDKFDSIVELLKAVDLAVRLL